MMKTSKMITKKGLPVLRLLFVVIAAFITLGACSKIEGISATRIAVTPDLWKPTNLSNAPAGRTMGSAVDYGSQMIIWGGIIAGNVPTDTGGLLGFDGFGGNWYPVNALNAPVARSEHTAVMAKNGTFWDGMIVWGGLLSDGTVTNTGGTYKPNRGPDGWIATSTVDAPSARRQHTAIVAPMTNTLNNKMLVWGGMVAGNTPTKSGGVYDPFTDTWAAMTMTSAPEARSEHSAVWGGYENGMIIWGGKFADGTPTNTGGIYDPVTDTWTAITTAGAPGPRAGHYAVWTGNMLIVWGGRLADGSETNTGGIYDPLNKVWIPMSTVLAPAASSRYSQYENGAWTGTEMLIFPDKGGRGSRYNPITDVWKGMAVTLDTPILPGGRPFIVWLGSALAVWSGLDAAGVPVNTGGIYIP